MPRIPANILDCSIYLYPTVQDAQLGRGAGGSGFLLGVSTDVQWHLYAVTNSHVVGEATVIRLNTKEGGFDVHDTSRASWFHHPEDDDLAVCPVQLSHIHKFSFVESERLILQSQVYDLHSVVPGMEVFLIGRFVGRDGQQRNTPMVRMGNVAQLPDEPILMPDGKQWDMFLVDMRTIGGSSGSLAITFTAYMELKAVPHSVNPSGMQSTWKEDWKLLGVNWGYLTERLPVCRQNGDQIEETDQFIQGNAGIACIVPAWKLASLLALEPLAEMRKAADITRRNRPENGRAVPSLG